MIDPKEHLINMHRTSSFDEPTRLFKYRLDRNERNQPFSPKFLERIRGNLTDELILTYPEPGQVYKKVAEWLGVEMDRIMLHLGSEQAIKAVFETYIRPKDKVLLHFPGFAMYPVYADLFQAEVVGQHFGSDLFFNWDAYIDKIGPDIRMVVVENPNGFLGTPIPLEALFRNLIEKARDSGTITLVDEAYFHFHNETVIDWIDEYENLIIVRTFSKAFGLAGLRIGYLVSRPENIQNLMKMKPSYEVISLAAMILCDLIDHPDEINIYLEDTKNNLAELKASLAELGIETSDSRANFLAVRLGDPKISEALRVALKKKDILIRRPFREPHLSEWVRISTSPSHVQKIMINELKAILVNEHIEGEHD